MPIGVVVDCFINRAASVRSILARPPRSMSLLRSLVADDQIANQTDVQYVQS
ncbi:hypothetical protein Mapa_012633 [Marchantia paleacea]|nr:hypothetical protein Mapa_012633 [Marchantia paleacea]